MHCRRTAKALSYTIFSVSFGLIILGMLTFISVLVNADNFSKGHKG